MVARAVKGRPGSFGVSGAAVLLACVGVALALGVVASSAPAPAPSFAAPKEYATGDGPVALASGDLNGDDKPDLVTANGKTISVLLNRGDGSFQARRDYRAGGGALAAGDLNGDGKLDLATPNGLLRGAVSVLLNRGDGSFRAKRDYRTGRGPISVAIGDLNGDRKLDLATANTYSIPNTRVYTASVLLNKGDGRFRASRDYRIGDHPDSIAIGDLNGDRKLDLVAPNSDEDTVSVLLNRGGGRFRAKRDYRTGRSPYAVAIGDLNGDGKLDLVISNLDSINGSVLLNKGNGSFRARRNYRGGTGTVAIGDLNGDRKLDLAIANGQVVSVLLNRGDGSFQAWLDYRVLAKLDYRTSANALWVAIGDLNGDRKPDLATSNLDHDTVSALINTPGLCVVQDVRRMTLQVATRTLARVNCHVGEVGSDYSEVFKRGLVMWQKPAPGAVEPDGDEVKLVVSRGRKQ
jgi:uncharacterized protein (DUF2141 family)